MFNVHLPSKMVTTNNANTIKHAHAHTHTHSLRYTDKAIMVRLAAMQSIKVRH